MKILKYLYHVGMYKYYTWRLHLDIIRVRAFLRSKGDFTPYTDEAIVQGIILAALSDVEKLNQETKQE